MTASPTIRIAGTLEDATHYYRVTAYSNYQPSLSSQTMEARTTRSACDWPALPTPFSQQAFENWATKPKCPSDLDCEIISDIRFKYQRKDTRLICCTCLVDPGPTPSNATGMCRHNGIHPHCYLNGFAVLAPSFIQCAGGLFSEACGSRSARVFHGRDSVTAGAAIQSAILPSIYENFAIEKHCAHGSKNCVRASVSMIVSAYNGACLSQDVIANRHYMGLQNSGSPLNSVSDLGHGTPVDCSGRDGSQCSEILKQVLGIGIQQNNKDVFTFQTTTPSFSEIRDWVDLGRPIMTEAKGHMRVLVGYCLGNRETIDQSARQWLYIYDPMSGPRAETYDSWSDSAIGTWVAPPNKPQLPAALNWSSDLVREDPPDVWQDSDNNGHMDYDEANRSSERLTCQP